MKQLSSVQVRQMWLDFWATKGHAVEPSVSLVPVNDPTLLWINFGVATLKKYFDGTIIPENPRITNAQKAIRTNDIENVEALRDAGLEHRMSSRARARLQEYDGNRETLQIGRAHV